MSARNDNLLEARAKLKQELEFLKAIMLKMARKNPERFTKEALQNIGYFETDGKGQAK